MSAFDLYRAAAGAGATGYIARHRLNRADYLNISGITTPADANGRYSLIDAASTGYGRVWKHENNNYWVQAVFSNFWVVTNIETPGNPGESLFYDNNPTAAGHENPWGEREWTAVGIGVGNPIITSGSQTCLQNNVEVVDAFTTSPWTGVKLRQAPAGTWLLVMIDMWDGTVGTETAHVQICEYAATVSDPTGPGVAWQPSTEYAAMLASSGGNVINTTTSYTPQVFYHA